MTKVKYASILLLAAACSRVAVDERSSGQAESAQPGTSDSAAAARPAPGGSFQGPRPPALRSMVLTEMASFGANDSPEDKGATGPMLAQIADIAEDEEGRVYVLDAAFKKIVVFQSDGTYSHTILGGHGQGPSEFMHPTTVDVQAGKVAVFDYAITGKDLH
jgi:hypothetical protein